MTSVVCGAQGRYLVVRMHWRGDRKHVEGLTYLVEIHRRKFYFELFEKGLHLQKKMNLESSALSVQVGLLLCLA